MDRHKKSTATVMLAFFVVMISFLAFIIIIPDKQLVDWLSFMFILLAEFTYFIGLLFIQMLPERTSHPASQKLLLGYLIATISLAGLFMMIRHVPTGLITGLLLGLFLATLAGLFIIGSRGRLVSPEDES